MHNPEVFIKSDSDREGYDIRTMTGRNAVSGDLGIEIECEGNKFPKSSGEIPSAWRYTHDGSLRGKDNAEYVLTKPVKFSEVKTVVNQLFRTLSDYGTVLDESNRTSVHVHLNVQRFHLPRLTTFLALYFSVEELLTEWCGDHRVGNLFCLRAKDAPAIVTKIKKWIMSDGRSELTEGLHYSGMNAQALVKFGSLEIRSLRGVTDPQIVIDWVSVLERLYTLSETYADPRLVTENFSGNDPLDYLKTILNEYYDVVRAGISMTDEEVRRSMYEGIRLAQDLCYCRDWSRYKPADVSKNPFGRNSKKSAFGLSLQEYLDLGGTPGGFTAQQQTNAPQPNQPVYINSVQSYFNSLGDTVHMIPTTTPHPAWSPEEFDEPEEEYDPPEDFDEPEEEYDPPEDFDEPEEDNEVTDEDF